MATVSVGDAFGRLASEEERTSLKYLELLNFSGSYFTSEKARAA